jgi:hypothetical protein
MLVQIAAGSDLYPSVTGPIVLLGTAILVVLGPSWTRWVGLAVPLVLGIGVVVAAVMTGDFIDQLTNTGNAPILLGSLMHVIGLAAAIGGGVGGLTGSQREMTIER